MSKVNKKRAEVIEDVKDKENKCTLDVRIHAIRPEGSIRATASVNINGAYAIKNIKVMDGSKGLFIAMPSYKTLSGEYKDICFPITKEAREQLNSAVFTAYEQALTQSQSQDQKQEPNQPKQDAEITMNM